MDRLAELLDRVESQEFDREAEVADIFSLAATDRPDEPTERAEQPRILDDSDSAPESDGDVPSPDTTADWEFDVYADEGATGDESSASSVLVPPVAPLSGRDVERLAVPAVICNSPGLSELESVLAARRPIPLPSVERKHDSPATDVPAPDSPARIELVPIAPAKEDSQDTARSSKSTLPLPDRASEACSAADPPIDEKPRPTSIVTDSVAPEAAARTDITPVPALRCASKPATGCRNQARPASRELPSTASPTSGLVQDFCVTPRRESPESKATVETKPALASKPARESTPAERADEAPSCLTLAAPNFEESLARQYRTFDYPLAAESPGKSEAETHGASASAASDRKDIPTSSAIEPTQPVREYSHLPETSFELPTGESDALIQACDNSRCVTPASAAAFPSRFVAPDFASIPTDPAGVHMLVVSDIAASPGPSPIDASASTHARPPASETPVLVKDEHPPLDQSQRSLRRMLSIEPRRAGESIAPKRVRSGKPQILNILAVVGGLLTLAALAYVASDLASWFGPIR
jgi:hypothetical protein